MIDYADYHPKWTLIRRLVLRRAGNCCEWCSVPNYSIHPITGSEVMLTVAHLDQNRDSNRFWNLAALCQRCHLGWDRRSHQFSRRYGRLTKYFNLRLFKLEIERSHLNRLIRAQQECTKAEATVRRLKDATRLAPVIKLSLFDKTGAVTRRLTVLQR